MASDIGVNINEADISTSHRLGKTSVTYNRPVIVKFTRRDTKRKVIMNRKELKDHSDYDKVYINDDLTRMRYRICKQLREEKFSVWTISGKIFYKDDEGTVSTVDTYEDLGKMNWSKEKLTELGILL